MAELNLYQQQLFDEWVISKDFERKGRKTTICFLTLKNGFEVVGTSACVDPADFDVKVGEFYALVDALSQIDLAVGFYRQCKLYKKG